MISLDTNKVHYRLISMSNTFKGDGLVCHDNVNKVDFYDYRSPSISRSMSLSDLNSSGSEENLKGCISFGEKCLSTILRLDKEHNMFGLSNITIVDSKLTRMMTKVDEEPAFPQTAIIQICCKTGCCKHKVG